MQSSRFCPKSKKWKTWQMTADEILNPIDIVLSNPAKEPQNYLHFGLKNWSFEKIMPFDTILSNGFYMQNSIILNKIGYGDGST